MHSIRAVPVACGGRSVCFHALLLILAMVWSAGNAAASSAGKPDQTARVSISADSDDVLRESLPDTLFGWLETSAPVLDEQGKVSIHR